MIVCHGHSRSCLNVLLFECCFSNNIEMKLKGFTESEGHQCISIVWTSCSKGCLRDVMLSNGISKTEKDKRRAENGLAANLCFLIILKHNESLYNVFASLMTINKPLYHCQSKCSVLRTDATWVFLFPLLFVSHTYVWQHTQYFGI